MFDHSAMELREEIDPAIDSRLRALEALLVQQIPDRMREAEVKLAAVPAQLQQAMRAAEQTADYAASIRRMVIRGPVAGSWIRNVAGVGGVIAIAVGLWWLSPAVSLVVTGALSLGLVVLDTLLAKLVNKKGK